MPATPQDLTLRSDHGPSEYPQLVAIWRSAVLATHGFLAPEDFTRIESMLASAYFPMVDLIVAEVAGEAVGFAGVASGNLEMLFVHDSFRGKGIGSALLGEAIASHGVTKVDVNEQNRGAHRFYLSQGFRQVDRSELDGEGRPYPILHMRLADHDWARPGSRSQDQMREVVLTGRLICKTAEETEVVAKLLPTHTELTRAEPGCISFEVTRTADPLVWQVEERFVSQRAFEAHQNRVGASEWGAKTSAIVREYVITGSDSPRGH